MLSSQTKKDFSESQSLKLKQLLACEQIELLSKASGGNSKVFCIQADHKQWAVKFYPPPISNQRDRLAAEYLAYQFLNEHQVTCVPTVKTTCLTERWLIMDWIEGTVPESYSSSDIEQAIYFIACIAQLNTAVTAKEIPLAAEACLSLDILLKQIRQRFERLNTIEETVLNRFLQDEFWPIFEKTQEEAKKTYAKNNIDPYKELALNYRSLIPADFGIHNSIRDNTGRLYFFDFDYFGWDDPVKLLADILWHPKMVLSFAQKEQFIMGVSAIYNKDPFFLNRFHYTLPLFGLRWVLILLNEFIPTFWQNRQHAEAHQSEFEAKKKQLNLAKDFLKRVQQMDKMNELTMPRSL